MRDIQKIKQIKQDVQQFVVMIQMLNRSSVCFMKMEVSYKLANSLKGISKCMMINTYVYILNEALI